jgi:hypothetical protein
VVASHRKNNEYDWGDNSSPYLDIKNADIFEPVEYLRRTNSTSHMVAAALLKLKLFLDLRSLDLSIPAIGVRVPPEILDNIRRQTLLSPVLAGKKDVMYKDRNSELIEKVVVQLEVLFHAAHLVNSHMWPVLFNPGDHLTARLRNYGIGTIEEVQVWLKWSYDAWIETPWGIEVAKRMPRRPEPKTGDEPDQAQS